MLDARERHILAKHRQKLRGSPARLDGCALVLEDGQRLDADLVILATGYRTGLGEIEFVKDGRPVPTPSVARAPLFEQALPTPRPRPSPRPAHAPRRTAVRRSCPPSPC
jgi:hypothetical protein